MRRGRHGGLVRRTDRPGENRSRFPKDFRFDPVTKDFETQSGGEQFGNTFDDWGNRFFAVQDIRFIRCIFRKRYLERNPLLSLPESVKRLVAWRRGDFSNQSD